MDPTRRPIIGLLHPSEMTPEERLDELASILAAGFLRLKAGMQPPENQAQIADIVAVKPTGKTESFLEVPSP